MHQGFARTFHLLFIALAFASCGALPRPDDSRLPFLTYAVSLKDLDLRVLHVRGTVYGARLAEVPLGPVVVSEGAAWEPIALAAADLDGGALRTRSGGARFIVENHRRDFTFDYDVVLRRGEPASTDVRGALSFLGGDRCRVLARDVLLAPEIPVDDGILLDVALWPDAPIASASASVGSRIIVPDRDELVSTLAVSGAYRTLSRTVGETTLVLAAGGTWSFGDDEFFDIVCRIVAAEVAMFGAPQRERYLFVLDRNPMRGGSRFDYYGLHEGGNIVLLVDPRLDRSRLIDTPMSIIAHEFFHNWNGEALRPLSDDFLWFTEGVTTYYSYRVLVDAGIITRAQYAAHAATIVGRYRSNPLRLSVAIGESGNSDMGDKDRVSLLYDGGFVAARALDERLRAETLGRCALIDVLRALCERASGAGAIDEAILASVVRDRCGFDVTPFLGMLVHTPAPRLLDDPSL